MLQAAIKLALAGGMFFPLQAVDTPSLEDFDPDAPLLVHSDITCPPLSAPPCPHQENKALGLTPRPYEVMVLLASGYTLKAIGRHLHIEVATPQVHTQTVFTRPHF